jgi:hydroxymethylpyrimidine/phosphomethylpyrimidine kinase
MPRRPQSSPSQVIQTRPTPQKPIALTIAGSDSGGGAGIQADLKTFSSLGVFGTSAITCITAQHPGQITNWQPLSASLVTSQIEAVLSNLPVAAAKTGMLGSEAIVRVVADMMATHRTVGWIVDPVLKASSGRDLMSEGAFLLVQKKLLPLATLVTPNIPEAEAFTGRRIRDLSDMKTTAQVLSARWGVACLLKGGHLPNADVITDVLCQKGSIRTWNGSRVGTHDLHGTGCTLSAGIAAWLARGADLESAIGNARTYLRQAIQKPVQIGTCKALGWPTNS